MEGFDDFENFIRTFVIDDGGCDTYYEQPYRQTDLGKSRTRFGVSWKTAEQYKAILDTVYHSVDVYNVIFYEACKRLCQGQSVQWLLNQ